MDSYIVEHVKQAIEDRINSVIEAEIEDAKERVAQRLRDEVARASLELATHYSIEQMKNELIIRVQHVIPKSEGK